ncbi:beta-2-glycoprotein 1-like isoform X2 [Brachyhypopomus gauderio]|uniref:beta-2-glycoprotein 1-like isoform X2 n=1 Tax=Brachyhypopomus gauderio TaxID=698409 RepID=UPI004041060C
MTEHTHTLSLSSLPSLSLTRSLKMKQVLHLLLLSEMFLLAPVTPEQVCPRPPVKDDSMVNGGQLFYERGTEVTLSCIKGYRPTGGSRKIICKSTGEWTERTLKCSPKQCPVPDHPHNGKVQFNGINYNSNISYSCDEGYVLHGNRSRQCLHTGQWSSPPPVCQPVTCGLPIIPPYAKIVYDRQVTDDVIEFGMGGTYECRPPMVLRGNRKAICTANGSWSKPPECKLVKCPQPPVIENGFLSFAEVREYGYGETVKYGCNGSYILDGPMEIKCTESGSWSAKPACRDGGR